MLKFGKSHQIIGKSHRDKWSQRESVKISSIYQMQVKRRQFCTLDRIISIFRPSSNSPLEWNICYSDRLLNINKRTYPQ